MYSMDGFINTYNKMNENQIDKSAIDEVIGLEKADNKNRRYKKRNEGISLSEKIARTEDTIEKIQNRILRRKIMEDIENEYQKQGIELPENIQFQYDNTKVKREELEEIYEKKLQELNVLKQTLNETEIISSL